MMMESIVYSSSVSIDKLVDPTLGAVRKYSDRSTTTAVVAGKLGNSESSYEAIDSVSTRKSVAVNVNAVSQNHDWGVII